MISYDACRRRQYQRIYPPGSKQTLGPSPLCQMSSGPVLIAAGWARTRNATRSWGCLQSACLRAKRKGTCESISLHCMVIHPLLHGHHHSDGVYIVRHLHRRLSLPALELGWQRWWAQRHQGNALDPRPGVHPGETASPCCLGAGERHVDALQTNF